MHIVTYYYVVIVNATCIINLKKTTIPFESIKNELWNQISGKS